MTPLWSPPGFAEVEQNGYGEGYFEYWNGYPHVTNLEGASPAMGLAKPTGKPNTIRAVDLIRHSGLLETIKAFDNGYGHWIVPYMFRVGNGLQDNIKGFSLKQTFTIDAVGTMSVWKGSGTATAAMGDEEYWFDSKEEGLPERNRIMLELF